MKRLILGIVFITLILFGCTPQVPTIPIEQPSEIAQPTIEPPVIPPPIATTPLSKIAFVRDCGSTLNWEIFTADSDGNNIIDITNKAGNDLWPSWSPNGKQIAFQASREWHGYSSIYVMDADGKNAKCLTPEKTQSKCPAWSPDGKSIAYSAAKLDFGAFDIFIMDTNGNNKIAVSPTTRTSVTVSSQLSPSWFPDCFKIAYTSNLSGLWEICDITTNNPSFNPYTYNSDISNSKRYKVCINNVCGLQFPIGGTPSFSFPTLSVSPNGKIIAFDYRNKITGKRDIYLLTIDTGELKCLTSIFLDNYYFPTWSPDSTKIAFTLETQNGDTDIYTIGIDGNNPKLLIKNGMFPSWSK